MAHIPCGMMGNSGGAPHISVSNHLCAPRRVSTVVLRGVGGATRSCLKRRMARTIVAMPTCFSSSRHRTAGRTKRVTKLRMGHVMGRPATTTLTCNLSGTRGSVGVTMFSLNNNAFSVSVLRFNNNIFRMLSAGNSARLNNSSFSRMVVG